MSGERDEAAKLAEEWAAALEGLCDYLPLLARGVWTWPGKNRVSEALASRLRPLLERLKGAEEQARTEVLGRMSDSVLAQWGRAVETELAKRERGFDSSKPLFEQVASLAQRLAEAEADRERLRQPFEDWVNAMELWAVKMAESKGHVFLQSPDQNEESRCLRCLRISPDAGQGCIETTIATRARLEEATQRAERAEADLAHWKDCHGVAADKIVEFEAQIATLQRERKERARAFRFDNSDRVIDLLKGDLELERAARQKAEEAARKLRDDMAQVRDAVDGVPEQNCEIVYEIAVQALLDVEAALTEEPGRGEAKDCTECGGYGTIWSGSGSQRLKCPSCAADPAPAEEGKP